jgi:hypothetical protein
MNNNKLNWLAASASLRVVALFCLFFSAVSTFCKIHASANEKQGLIPADQ